MAYHSIPYLTKYDKHVVVDAVVDLLPAAVQRILKVFNYLLCLVMGGVLFYYGSKMTVDLIRSGLVLFDTLEPPKYIFMLFVPLCFLPFLVIAFKKLIGSLRLWGAVKPRGNH